MSIYTAIFSNPAENYAGTGVARSVPVESFSKEAELGAVSACAIVVREEILALYSDETDDSNPIQLNSTVTLTRSDGAVVFRGYVVAKPYLEEFEDGNTLTISCWGKEGVLTGTFCPYGGSFQWTRQSTPIQCAAVSFQPSAAWEGYTDTDTLWPDPIAEPLQWVQDADSPVATLNAGILAGATDIILTAGTGADFAPRGWVRIDDGANEEWVYYPCCWYNGANWQLGDTAGVGAPCVRGELGTAAVGFAGGTSIWNKAAKNVAPGQVVLRNPLGATLGSNLYRWNWALGCLILTGAAAAGVYSVDYWVYDSDGTLGGTAITLADIVTSVLTADSDQGGAEFAAGDIAVTAPLGINRVEYDPKTNSPYAWSFIEELLDALAIAEEYYLYYDHAANDVVFKALVQTLIPDITVDWVKRIDADLSIEDVVSGVLVNYESDGDKPLLDTSRAWHPAATGAGSSPDHFAHDTAAPSWQESASHGHDDAAGSAGLQYCIDSKMESKFGGEFTHDPGGEWLHSIWWFQAPIAPSTIPPSVRTSKLGMSIGTYRACGSTWGRARFIPGDESKYEARIDGATNFDTAAPAGAYDWQPLLTIRGENNVNGGASDIIYSPDALINQDINAIRVVWVVAPGPKTAGDNYWGYVHALVAEGSSTGSYVHVRLSDVVADMGNMERVVAAASYEKMRGGVNASIGVGGASRGKLLEIGASNMEGALALARTLLLQKLILYESRSYEIVEYMPTLPELGDTIAVDEDGDGAVEYTGLLRGYNITDTPEGTVVTIRLLDYGAGFVE
jgi:hypothetical protein